MNTTERQADPIRARKWVKILAPYRTPDQPRSILEIAVTVLPFIGLWAGAWAALSVSYGLTLLIAVPAAGFLARIFMIQHDCGHGAFFNRRSVNDWVGRMLGVVTMTPYDVWRRAHAIHHASSGNLARRGVGDITTLTVREYEALPRWRRLAYRLYRQPLVMFGLGPAYLFLLQNRLPIGFMRDGWRVWASAMATNAAIALAAAGLVWLMGAGPLLMVHGPIILLAASIGVWLFYVQHQFEETFWADQGTWKLQDAALYGSSHYDLPAPLRWITANIGIHHVHHLSSRIPYYRLPAVLRAHPELANIRRLTLAQSVKGVRLALWDEERGRLVSFRQARA